MIEDKTRVVCSNCKSKFLVGYSCKTRMLCPSCHAKRLTIWSEWLGAELLEDVPGMVVSVQAVVAQFINTMAYGR